MPSRNPLASPIDIQKTAVVIPTYSERDDIAKIIEALLRLYPATHILVVYDRSPDCTAGIGVYRSLAWIQTV